MVNFFTPWEDAVTEYKADDMNAPLATLDQALSFLKNPIIWCDGNITASRGITGELAWDSYLRVAYLDVDGNTITNKCAAGSIDLGINEFAYLTLSATDDATISMSKSSVTGDAACTFADNEIVVIAYKASADSLFFVNLKPQVLTPFDIGVTYIGKPTAGATILRLPFAREVTFEADMDGSYGVCGVSPTSATQDFSIQHEGTEFATMTFSNGSNDATFSGEKRTFVAGEVLTVVAPDPQDSTLADLGVVFAGTRGF